MVGRTRHAADPTVEHGCTSCGCGTFAHIESATAPPVLGWHTTFRTMTPPPQLFEQELHTLPTHEKVVHKRTVQVWTSAFGPAVGGGVVQNLQLRAQFALMSVITLATVLVHIPCAAQAVHSALESLQETVTGANDAVGRPPLHASAVTVSCGFVESTHNHERTCVP